LQLGGERREVERGTVIVEYKRFRRKKIEKGGRINKDIG
jgi:antirestriction protein ArdC